MLLSQMHVYKVSDFIVIETGGLNTAIQNMWKFLVYFKVILLKYRMLILRCVKLFLLLSIDFIRHLSYMMSGTKSFLFWIKAEDYVSGDAKG